MSRDGREGCEEDRQDDQDRRRQVQRLPRLRGDLLRLPRQPALQFVSSYVEIGRVPETKNVTIRYATDSDGDKEDEFDLVVLGVGLAPPAQVDARARIFGIELSEHGFCKTSPGSPLETTRRGIFVSGAFMGPMDIPEAVGGQAHGIAQRLAASRPPRISFGLRWLRLPSPTIQKTYDLDPLIRPASARPRARKVGIA